MELLFFIMLVVTNCASALLSPAASTSGGSGLNLYGKMFTLSAYEGGLIVYSPYMPPPWSSPTPYSNRDYTPRYNYRLFMRQRTTPKYQNTPKAPYNPTEEIYTPMDEPYTPNKEPYTPNEETYTSNEEPYTPNEKPHTPNKEPYTPNEEPYTPNKEPYTPNEDPYTSNEEPYTPNEKPHTPNKESYTPNEEPYTPNEEPYTATRAPYTTHYHTTTSWTTAPTTRGVTVCLRYILDSAGLPIFTLSPSSTPLTLRSNGPLSYTLLFNGYSSTYLQPSIRLWSDMGQNMWTSACVTMDTVKKVVQMFRNYNMSSRKLLPTQYTWSGEPVIDFSGFEGQVTDVQVWDYPLHFKEVLYYMSSGFYGRYQGSVLSWSYISYSVRGKTLLEENYEQQMKLPSDRATRGRHLKWDKKPRKGFKFQKSKERRKQLM